MKKYILVICSVLLVSVLFLGEPTSASQITEIVTAKSSWQNTGNIVKGSTNKFGHCRNYSGYGTLNKTKVRVIAKLDSDFTTVYVNEKLLKNSEAEKMKYTNTVDEKKIIRFCYKLPEDSAGVSADTCKITYNLY